MTLRTAERIIVVIILSFLVNFSVEAQTPTPTPSSVYTHTLSSDHLLVVQTTADFGELIIVAALLALLTLLILAFVFRLVYRR